MVFCMFKSVFNYRITDIRMQEMVDGHENVQKPDCLGLVQFSSGQLKVHFAAVSIGADHRGHESE